MDQQTNGRIEHVTHFRIPLVLARESRWKSSQQVKSNVWARKANGQSIGLSNRGQSDMTVDSIMTQVDRDSGAWVPIKIHIGLFSRKGGDSETALFDQTVDILWEGRQLRGRGLNMASSTNGCGAEQLLDPFVGIISGKGLSCIGTSLIIGQCNCNPLRLARLYRRGRHRCRK